ncbi:MAG: uridine kinase [Cyanobacteria bacterium P01_A01_bin.70]
MADSATTFDQMVTAIAALSSASPVTLIAIDGCGGAGKSTLTSRLKTALATLSIDVQVVHFDDFYRPSSQRQAVALAEPSAIGPNFDWQRLRESVLIPLHQGNAANYQKYNWATDALIGEPFHIKPVGVVCVEGVYSSRPELACFYDRLIWVTCPRAVRLRRGLERDGESARALWEGEWMPQEDQYVRDYRPQAQADWVIDGADGDSC